MIVDRIFAKFRIYLWQFSCKSIEGLYYYYQSRTKDEEQRIRKIYQKRTNQVKKPEEKTNIKLLQTLKLQHKDEKYGKEKENKHKTLLTENY